MTKDCCVKQPTDVFPLPDFGGVSAEETYFKIATLLEFFQKSVREEDFSPVLSDQEYFGVAIFCKEVLADLELLTFGTRPWTDPDKAQEARK